MKGIYDVLSISLILGSLFFFVQSTRFLAGKDYLAGALTLVIGFTVVKAGVELARLSVVIKRGD